MNILLPEDVWIWGRGQHHARAANSGRPGEMDQQGPESLVAEAWVAQDWCQGSSLKRVYRAMNEGESDITDTDSDSEHEEYDTTVDDDKWEPASIENLPPVEEKDIENYFLFRK